MSASLLVASLLDTAPSDGHVSDVFGANECRRSITNAEFATPAETRIGFVPRAYGNGAGESSTSEGAEKGLTAVEFAGETWELMRSEALNVVAVAGVIIGGVGFYIAQSIDRSSTNGLAGERDLLPYQMLESRLPSEERERFAELQEALPMIEELRAASGRWPDVPELAAQGPPAVTGADADRSGAVRWRYAQQGFFVNYLRLPAEPTAVAWLIVFQEPDPNAPPDTAPDDETHHRLPDGTLLHVTLWMRRAPDVPAGMVLSRPQVNGWIQVSNEVPTPLRR